MDSGAKHKYNSEPFVRYGCLSEIRTLWADRLPGQSMYFKCTNCFVQSTRQILRTCWVKHCSLYSTMELRTASIELTIHSIKAG